MSTVVEIMIVLAVLSLCWIIWQLKKAKQFNQFKQLLAKDIKKQVINHIYANLESTRNNIYPNNEIHQTATIEFWTSYKVRVLQAALIHEIIDEQWLKSTGNWRNSQHLFHIEHAHMAQTIERIDYKQKKNEIT